MVKVFIAITFVIVTLFIILFYLEKKYTPRRLNFTTASTSETLRATGDEDLSLGFYQYDVKIPNTQSTEENFILRKVAEAQKLKKLSKAAAANLEARYQIIAAIDNTKIGFSKAHFDADTFIPNLIILHKTALTNWKAHTSVYLALAKTYQSTHIIRQAIRDLEKATPSKLGDCSQDDCSMCWMDCGAGDCAVCPACVCDPAVDPYCCPLLPPPAPQRCGSNQMLECAGIAIVAEGMGTICSLGAAGEIAALASLCASAEMLPGAEIEVTTMCSWIIATGISTICVEVANNTFAPLWSVEMGCSCGAIF